MGSITVWFGLKTSKPSSFPNYFFEKTFQKNIMNKNPDPRLGPIFDVAFGTNYGAPPPANGSNNGSAHPNPHFDPNVAYFHVHMAEKDKLVNQLLEEIHQKDEEISFKNQELTNKNGQIARKDEELAIKSLEIAKKDEEISIKNGEIEKGNKIIVKVTEDLDRYEMAGEAFFKSINGLKETPRKIQNWLKRKRSQVEAEEIYEALPTPTVENYETPEYIRNEKRKQSLKTIAELEKVRLMLNNDLTLTDLSMVEDQGNCDEGNDNGSTNGLVDYNLTQSTAQSDGSSNGSGEISPAKSVIANVVKVKKPEELLDDAII